MDDARLLSADVILNMLIAYRDIQVDTLIIYVLKLI